MKAYVTSIGEKTTGLCVQELEDRFEVVLLEDKNTSLWEKLKWIYGDAEDDFVRVDADVIPNRNLTEDYLKTLLEPNDWWLQFLTYDWYKQDVTYGGVQFIKREAIPYLRSNIDDAANDERPETYVYRIKEFDNPRRCKSHDIVMGLHGYKNDMLRVYEVKKRRGQLENYDFGLARRINSL